MLNSIYSACITMTTVGLGDVTPKTQGGRLYACFYIPAGVVVLLNVIGNIAKLVSSSRSGDGSFELTELVEMDNDGDGTITKVEFLQHMLR